MARVIAAQNDGGFERTALSIQEGLYPPGTSVQTCIMGTRMTFTACALLRRRMKGMCLIGVATIEPFCSVQFLWPALGSSTHTRHTSCSRRARRSRCSCFSPPSPSSACGQPRCCSREAQSPWWRPMGRERCASESRRRRWYAWMWREGTARPRCTSRRSCASSPTCTPRPAMAASCCWAWEEPVSSTSSSSKTSPSSRN
mmetsp:Transcript_2917/g.5506  ORF Transcript_2917/g.5506 Transcript_2917/m.5506 type:complete len:200 (-) Transcript_2917:905-1504(-)